MTTPTNSNDHLRIIDSDDQFRAPPTTFDKKLQWPISTTTFVWPTLGFNNHLWLSTTNSNENHLRGSTSTTTFARPTPILPSRHQLRAVTTTSDYKLRRKSSSMINFDNHLPAINSDDQLQAPTTTSKDKLRQPTPIIPSCDQLWAPTATFDYYKTNDC